MFYDVPQGREVEVLQGDRVVTKVGGVNAIVIAKDPDKEGRVILFAVETREKFVCNIGLLFFVSRGRVPRNSGPRLNTSRPVYPSSFRTVHLFDQVVIHATHTVGIVSGFDSKDPDREYINEYIEVTDMDGERSRISVHGVSLIRRDNGLIQQLREVMAA